MLQRIQGAIARPKKWVARLALHRYEVLRVALIAAPFLYLAGIAALFGAEIFWPHLLPADLPEGDFAKMSGYEGFLKDISLYLLATQAALIGIVFPITLALVTFIMQRDAAASESVGIRIYFSQSLARPVGMSGILLVGAIALHMVGYIHFPFSWQVLQPHSFIFVRMGGVGLHIMWFALNLAGLGYLLLFSLGFVSSEKRETARQTFALRHVLPAHKQLLALKKDDNTDSPLRNPALILEQLSEDVIAHIHRNAYTGFAAAIDEMVRFHIFLLEEYESKDGNLATQGVRLSFTTSVEWVMQYSRVIRATVDAPNEITFLSYLAYAYLPVLKALGVRDTKLSGDALVFYERLVKEIDSWAIAQGVDAEASNPMFEAAAAALVNLSRSHRSRYLNAVRVVDSAWMRVQTDWDNEIDRIFASGDANTWEKVRPYATLQLDHLRRSLGFFAQAVWSGNHAGATFYFGRLFAWAEDLSDYWYDVSPVTAVVTPDIFHLTSTEVRTRYHVESDGAYRSLFEAALRNAWRDSMIMTAVIIGKWRTDGKIPRDRFVEITDRLLANVDNYLGDGNAFPGIFETFSRLSYSDLKVPGAAYPAHLHALVALIDGKSDREDRPLVRDRGPQTQWAFTPLLTDVLTLALSRGVSDAQAQAAADWLQDLIRARDLLPFGDGSLNILHYRFSLTAQFLGAEQPGASPDALTRLRGLLEVGRSGIAAAWTAAIASAAVTPGHRSRAALYLTRRLPKALHQGLPPFKVGVWLADAELRRFPCRRFAIRDIKGAMLLPPIRVPGSHSLDDAVGEIVRRVRAEAWRLLPTHNHQTLVVNTPEELAGELRQLARMRSRWKGPDLFFYCPRAKALLLRQHLADDPEQGSRSSGADGYLFSFGGIDVYGIGGTSAGFAVDSSIIRGVFLNVDESGRAVQVEEPSLLDGGDHTGLTFCFLVVLHQDARYTEFDIRF